MATPREQNHGEGNPEADRVYREGLQKFVRSGPVEKKAREAADALEGPPKAHSRSRKK